MASTTPPPVEIDILTINDQEARQYAETSSLLAAARAILANGPSGVIIKKGEHGVIFVSDDEGGAAQGDQYVDLSC